MLVNVFLILVSYYVIKTVREPLILGTEVPQFLQALGIKGAAEVKTYAAAGQALVLMAFVPAYSWFASRVDRMRLIVGVTLFFVANILAFAVAVHAGVPFIGVAFYVWVGFFSLSIIAQFWSYANDIYTKDAGDRLFPVIGIGATAGSPVGAWIAGRLFHLHVSAHLMLYLAAGLLLLTLVLYVVVNRGAAARAARREPRRAGDARQPGRLLARLRQPLHPADRGAAHRPERRQHRRRVHPEPPRGGARLGPRRRGCRPSTRTPTSAPTTAATSSG